MGNEILIFVIASFVIFLIENHLMEKKKKHDLDTLERQFLLGTICFEQYKYQMLQIMELVYEKAGESDPQFVKDFEKIKQSIIEKCDKNGDLWVNNLKNILGRKTEYSNWKEATKYSEGILNKIKNDNKFGKDN
jgi:hypothetical protein